MPITMDELVQRVMTAYRCDEAKARELAAEIMPLYEKRTLANARQKRRRNHFFRNVANRRAIYGRDEGHCAMCGTFIPFEEMTLGHLVPVSANGKSDWWNVQLECEPCNFRKGAKIIPRRESGLEPPWPENGRRPPLPGSEVFPLVQPPPQRIPDQTGDDPPVVQT